MSFSIPKGYVRKGRDLISDTLKLTFNYVDGHVEDFIGGLKELLRIPSIAVENRGVNEAAEFLEKTMRDLGLSTRITQTAGSPVVFGERIDNPGKPTVLIYGHYDVQPAEPLDAWASPPFEPTMRNGRIYARGVGDNKGQLYAQLMGVRAYLAVHGKLPCNVKFVLEGEEENDSPNLHNYVSTHRDSLRAHFVYVSDGPLHESGAPMIVLGVRGIISIELRAKGASRDLHSGNWGGPIPNPAWTLVNLLSSMKDPKTGKVTIEGFYDNVRQISREEHEAVVKLPFDGSLLARDLGLPILEKMEPAAFYERIMFRPNLNICAFQSGANVPGVKTIIPSTASAKIDIRLVADQNPDFVFERFRDHVKALDPDVDVIRYGQMWPTRTPLENRYVRKIAEAVEDVYEVSPMIYPCAGGSLPTYVFSEILGLPVISVPYANADESNHAPNENLAIGNFVKGIKTCASVLEKTSELG